MKKIFRLGDQIEAKIKTRMSRIGGSFVIKAPKKAVKIHWECKK